MLRLKINPIFIIKQTLLKSSILFVENRNVKNPFSALLFEGDMLVEPRLKKIALNGGDISMAATGRKRGATTNDLWPNGVIPYKISSSLSSQFLYCVHR